MQYLALNRDSLALEDSDGETENAGTVDAQTEIFDAYDERTFANRFLRRLLGAGWLSEETLADFTRVINITAWGKPFFEALVQIEEGHKTEYESHVVNVYSSLCGETVKENGHFMVLKAREETSSLIDSLKVLSQSIKVFYDKINADAKGSAAAALHEHYDIYAGEVLDKAYKRLKTSDNVSRYRPRIFKQITALLSDDKWLDESATRYVRILQTSRTECRNRLIAMLEEIREDLRSVDDIENEIDRRNAAYSRSSTEIIKAYLEPDSTIAGKIGNIIKAIYAGDDGLNKKLAHSIYRVRFLSQSAFTFRRERSDADFINESSGRESEAESRAVKGEEAALIMRVQNQPSMRKIALWLDSMGGTERILYSEELIKDEESFLNFIYALLYGDSRRDFSYIIEDNNCQIETVAYRVPDVRFRRKEG